MSTIHYLRDSKGAHLQLVRHLKLYKLFLINLKPMVIIKWNTKLIRKLCHQRSSLWWNNITHDNLGGGLIVSSSRFGDIWINKRVFRVVHDIIVYIEWALSSPRVRRDHDQIMYTYIYWMNFTFIRFQPSMPDWLWGLIKLFLFSSFLYTSFHNKNLNVAIKTRHVTVKMLWPEYFEYFRKPSKLLLDLCYRQPVYNDRVFL